MQRLPWQNLLSSKNYFCSLAVSAGANCSTSATIRTSAISPMGAIFVFINGDDEIGFFHAGQVLNGTADPTCHIQLRPYGCPVVPT